MKILKNKSSRVLIIAMSTLFILALFIANYYYKYQNLSLDPRVYDARKLYERYNDLAVRGNHDSVFVLMDTIEKIYNRREHYKRSYEVGVLYNNRAATYITLALDAKNDSIEKDSFLNLAKNNALTSIEIYSEWIDKWSNLSDEELKEKIIPHFNNSDSAFKDKNINRFINKRVSQIKEARVETPRRLSVSHTNLGIVLRHKEKYEEAIEQYFLALELWPDNLAAENNLNILFDKPLKKRSVIRHFFPKDRF